MKSRGSVRYTLKIGMDIHNVVGRKTNNEGYVLLKIPTHPFCMSNGYVLEHRVIFESIINRYLEGDVVVHHLNGIKDDNRFSNLSLMNRSEHTTLHHKGAERSEQARENNSIAQIKLNRVGVKHQNYKNIDEDVKKLFEQGVPVSNIADLTKVTKRTVYNRIKKLELKGNDK